MLGRHSQFPALQNQLKLKCNPISSVISAEVSPVVADTLTTAAPVVLPGPNVL